jgi:hypothetical protein
MNGSGICINNLRMSFQLQHIRDIGGGEHMFGRAKWGAVAAAAVLAVSVPVLAQVHSTVVLKSGERHSVENLSFRWDKGHVAVAANQWRVGDVAYIDFGGAPDVNLNLTGSEEAVVLRDGRVIRGQVLELGVQQNSGDFLVIVKDQAGQEHRLQVGQVARAYFAGGTAAAATSGRTAATPDTAGGGIVVRANQQWTSTGLVVRRGEWLTVNTTGQIQLSGDAADVAGSAGSTGQRMAAGNAPLPNALAGALVARIGNGQVFAIGNQARVQMPDSGQLFLGINDDHVADNNCEFRVEIQRAGRRR